MAIARNCKKLKRKNTGHARPSRKWLKIGGADFGQTAPTTRSFGLDPEVRTRRKVEVENVERLKG